MAPGDDNVSADSWFKQLDPGSEKELSSYYLLCTLVCWWPGNPTLMSSLFPNRDPKSSFSEIPEFRFYSQLVTIYCSSRNVHIYYIYIHFCGGASIWSVESTEGPYVKPGNRAFVTESESRKTFLMKTSRKAPPH